MGSIAGNSLDLIRTVFSRNNVLPLPSTYWDAAARGAFFMQQGFPGITTGGSNGHLADSVRLEEDLMNRYADYAEMDQFPELGAAIDLFADDATVQDVMTGKSIWFEAEDETVDHILNDMIEVNLKLENELWEIARSLCKDGNEFIEPIVLDNVGVVKLNHIPPPWMRRIEDMNGILYGYMQDPAMQFTIDTRTFLERIKNKNAGPLELPTTMTSNYLQVYEPWEIVHMRLRSRARRDLYGFSVVEAARYAWKRLAMMEDAMLMYKVTRSPQRYAFYVDVGDVPPNQARGLLNRIKNDFKKSRFIDERTGKPSFRYSPLCLSLETKIPVINSDGEAPLKSAIKTLSELIADYDAGIKNWTYSINVENGELVKGEIVWAGITRKDAEVLSVIVNEKEMVVTPDHKFLLSNLEYKEAKDLLYTDKVLSIDPIYKKTFSQNITAVGKIRNNQDTGCITVEKWHNFALDSGCFVKNSAEDDFFIPVRKERKGTEIEVLAGPEGQSVEDTEYFLNKVFAALKIPKSYLGADETVGRANLSQLDVRLCRSVMRVQRELKNGFRQIARVDLAAKNIDPDRTAFECHMVVPSGVFELAQIEVEKAKLELASSYKDAQFSQYWIYSKILGLSDEEILQIQNQRTRENSSQTEVSSIIRDQLPRMVDRAANRSDPRADRYQQKILDEIESGNTKLGRKLRELKLLTQEVRGTLKTKRFNGRR